MKRIIIFSILALIITISCIFWNLDDLYRIKAEKLYSATSVIITNAKGESVTIDSVDTQELVDSMGSLPLTKATDRIKTPFSNKMKFYIKDKLIYEISFGMPSIFNKNSQVIIKNKPYIINNGFYHKLDELEEKYNLSFDTL